MLRRGAGHRRGGQRPATVRYRARGSGPGCPPSAARVPDIPCRAGRDRAGHRIRRELAEARPDAFRPDLAMSLNNLSARLAELGRREEALAAIEEAIGIYRELAAARPGRVPARPGHVAEQPVEPAGAIWGGGRRRWPRSRRRASIYRELAAARPDAFRPDLAMSLNNHVEPAGAGWGGGRRRWPRSSRPSASTGSWPRPAPTRSCPTWPCR